MNVNTTISNTAIADLVLARIAGESVDNLDGLISEETGRLIEMMLSFEEKMRELGEPLCDMLYEVVPFIEEKSLSGAVLRLRRDVHNGREPTFNTEQREKLLQYMSQEQRMLFDRWYDLFQAKTQIQQNLPEAYDKATAAACEHLKRYYVDQHEASESEFLSGLALVSEDFVQSLKFTKKKPWKVTSNLVKTSFSYVQRSIAKASPFSTLTQLQTATFESPRREIEHRMSRSNVRWNRSLVSFVAEEIAKQPAYSHAFQFRLTDGLTIDGKSVRILGKYMDQNGFSWKKEEVVSNNKQISMLANLPERFQESFLLSDLQDALTFPNKTVLMKLLFSQKILRPIIPFSAKVSAPFAELVRHLRTNGVEDAELFQSLTQLDELKRQFSESWNVERRIELLKQIKEDIHHLLQVMKAPVPNWLERSNIMYEDVRSAVPAPVLGEHVQEDLRRLQTIIKPFTFRLALYDEIVQYFKETVGVGQSINLLEFMIKITQSETMFSHMTARARLADTDRLGVAQPIDERIGPVMTTVYYQIAAQSHEDVLQGNYQLVINKIGGGKGTIFARFNQLFETETYQNKLRAWLQDSYPEQRILEFSVAADWSNLQEHFGVLEESVRWIGELPYAEESYKLPIDRMILVHDPATDELIMKTPEGKRVAPIYLGTVPEYLASGLAKVFLTLATPIAVSTPYGIAPNPLLQPAKPDHVLHVPRETDGRIVLNREKWLVPHEDLAFLTETATPLQQMVKMQRFVRMHGLPQEVFMTVTSSEGGRMSTTKPFWLHFQSPFTIEFLKRQLHEKTQYVTFVEALPGKDSCWLKNQEQRPVVTEFMTLGRC